MVRDRPWTRGAPCLVLAPELPCGDSHMGRRGVMGSEAAGAAASPGRTLPPAPCTSAAVGSAVTLRPRGLPEMKLNAETCLFHSAPGRRRSPTEELALPQKARGIPFQVPADPSLEVTVNRSKYSKPFFFFLFFLLFSSVERVVGLCVGKSKLIKTNCSHSNYG